MTKLRTGLLLASLLAGCGERAESSEEFAAEARSGASAVQLCAGTRVVAVLEDPSAASPDRCELGGELPASWRATPLFEGGSPQVAALAQAAPGELRRFCSYEWAGAGPAPIEALLASLEGAAQLQGHSLGLDCGRGLGLGELDEGVGAALLDSFRLQIGWLSGPELEASTAARVPVEVAVVDTVSQRVAEDPALEPNHPHGEIMAALIADVSCPDQAQACREQIRHVLALPRLDGREGPDWTAGGGLGTPSDVALGVYLAVERWRRRAAAERLIINLSVGWEQAAPGRGPDRALQAALEYASCQGALVFAAAGNSRPSSCEPGSGPLTPASFESLPAPSAAECRSLGLLEGGEGGESREAVDPSTAAVESLRPLVYAVGGVDGRGLPLANGRPGGRPRLATAAAQGLARDGEGQLTRALSGSSVAAAVASGAAALLWSYRPQLRPDELVELLHRSGVETGADADFGLARAASEIRRVSVCAALAQACADEPGGPCPALACSGLDEASAAGSRLVEAAVAERRARAPESVRVHRDSAQIVESSCDEELGRLAAPL